MNFELVVAMSKNGVIGCDNKIPWYIPEDLAHFRDLTNGSIVIMGRKTFESLPNGQPLHNRLNLVLSKSNIEGIHSNNNVKYVNTDNIYDVIKYYRKPDQKIFIIGGSEIYSLFIRQCDKLHITVIDEIIEGDAYFPLDKAFLEKYYDLVHQSDVLYSKNQNIKFQYYTYQKKHITQFYSSL